MNIALILLSTELVYFFGASSGAGAAFLVGLGLIFILRVVICNLYNLIHIDKQIMKILCKLKIDAMN